MATKLHDECLKLAETLIDQHIEEEDGEKCFNLFTYLEELESKLESKFHGAFKFSLDAHQAARFLWCCIAEDPYPDRFRGMPVLD